MVNFGQLLGKTGVIKPIDPIEIFQNLNKQPGKEYLWPPQEAVLKEWHTKVRAKKDVIVKLHTGQGKTLIALLMLQSCLNEGKGPALYICPNNYLVDQIIEQSKSFGIKTVKFNGGFMPQSFLNSEAILVCNCNKLFNGKSIFGVRGARNKEPTQLGVIVIDDAHKCLDIIRQSFSITIDRFELQRKNQLYQDLWNLFEDSLRTQAPGTCADIINKEDCIMAVPFWSWYDKRSQVLEILSQYKETDQLLFVWDLLKDHIDECICFFSGDKVEISPRLLPIDSIPSFSEANRRILLSATLNEDAFLVKDMGIAPEAILNPLSSSDVKYSGERLIVLPSLVDSAIQRGAIISWAQKKAARNNSFGVIAIVPSNKRAQDWLDVGSKVTSVANLYEKIDCLKMDITRKAAKTPLVLVNEYDGVDLPGDMCRILILDSLPSYSNLADSYLHEVNPFSGILRRQLAQRVEQGMGRAIRGSSDWCIVIVIGNDLTNFISEKSKRAFLSHEAQLQILIGEDLVQIMKEEGGKMAAIDNLVNQALNRDENWKTYYKERMSQLKQDMPVSKHLDRAIVEREAELLYRQGQYRPASEKLGTLIAAADSAEKGWLFQLIATYLYPIDSEESMNKQIKAHSENQNLFRPLKGVVYSKVQIVGTRPSRIIDWIKQHDSWNAIKLEVNRISENLLWGTPNEPFEQGVQELGVILGLFSERPERKTGAGPDNLWHIQGKSYWLIECKNRVSTSREKIYKDEAGQLSNSIAWFKKNYETDEGIPVIIHPSKVLNDDAFIDKTFYVMQEKELAHLRENAVKFYNALSDVSFDGLSIDIVSQKLKAHELDTESLFRVYLQRGGR